MDECRNELDGILDADIEASRCSDYAQSESHCQYITWSGTSRRTEAEEDREEGANDGEKND